MNNNIEKFTRDDARAIVGLGSVLVVLQLINMKEFTRYMIKTEDWVIEEPEWLSKTFFELLCQRDD